MEVIPETFVPDGGYSRNVCTWWRLFQKRLYLMEVIPETFAPDGGYSRNVCTWWRLFQKRLYLMEVIPETFAPDGGYSRNASWAQKKILYKFILYKWQQTVCFHWISLFTFTLLSIGRYCFILMRLIKWLMVTVIWAVLQLYSWRMQIYNQCVI
jgi:hypothetical protein